MQLIAIDWIILGVYFVFVLGIGYALRRYMRTSSDYFLSGRSIPAWVAGLAFLSANLGAQEVIGMAASGAKYGMATSHFYWIGAIPAMVFLGVFMMPFYYGSRARSVPEYLKLRFDEKTRGLNAISFAAMTIFSSGISRSAVRKPGQLPAWPTKIFESSRETTNPSPQVVWKSGSTQWTRCISRSVVAFSTSVPPLDSRRNCHDANFARSPTVDA